QLEDHAAEGHVHVPVRRSRRDWHEGHIQSHVSRKAKRKRRPSTAALDDRRSDAEGTAATASAWGELRGYGRSPAHPVTALHDLRSRTARESCAGARGSLDRGTA